MRNFLLLLAVTASVALSVSNVAAQTYCAPPAVNLYTTGCTDPDNIESFSTTGGSTNITNNNTGCSTPSTAYTYFSSMTHTAVQGTTVNFSFTNGGSFTEYYKIWVDFNANGTLDDAGELVYTNSTKIATNQVVTGSFTIPMSTVPGTKRIRVRCVYSNNTFTPCSEETWGEVEDYNLQVIASTPCSGTPVAGNAESSVTNILCPGQNFTLSLNGSSLTSGLSYQWESSTDNITFTPIAGATNFNYTTTQAAPVMYYRAVVTCTNPGGGSATSASVQVTNGSGPTYAPLPYIESFENVWMNTCNTREIPNNSWRNTPGTGNNSWRRNDDGAAAAWTAATGGAYTPPASDGLYSARFHSNNAPSGTTGQFDLHLNCATAAANKRVQFDFINTSGTDSLAIYLSTDGGSTYSRLDSVLNAADWRKKSVVFNSTSATTIVRFIAYSDDGTSDIGVDNLRVTDFDNCSGVPVAGTASNNAPANVCAGVPFTLTVTGQTDANLLTYQWEASTDGGTTWTAIPGATTETYVTSQFATTIYRLRITCTNGGGTAVSTTTTVTSPPIPAGVYTIDKNNATTWPVGTNFNSFNAAYAAMSCGIGAAVTFNVVAGSGPYNEQLIMAPVRNTNATNTVTFNGNGETITFATTATERAVIKLNGAGFIRFENLVVVPTATTNAYGFQLSNDADSNIIRNNTINLSLTATSNTLAGIVISGSNEPTGTGTTSALHDFNQILNNTINGGYYGITLTATPAGGANGNNTIRGNFIKDFYQYGIYVAGSYNTVIDSNFISRPTRTTEGNFEGIYFTTQSNLSVVSRNRISNPFGGLASPTASLTFNGINFNSASASAGNDNTIVNNVVLCVNNTNAVANGFTNTNSTSVSYFHNTIVLDEATSTASGATRGINIAGTADGILTYNNLVVITRGGSGPKHGFYLASSLLLGSDYNDVYVNATNAHWGFYQINRTTLANWQSATAAAALDQNSYQANPVLMNLAGCGAASVCIANAGMDNKGLYIGVDVDAEGNARDVNTPDIGAFECTPPPCTIPPVTGTTMVTPTTICQGLPVALNLNIGAYGAGQTFQWQWSDDNVTWVDMGTPMLTPDTTINADSTVWLRVKITCTASAVEYSDAVLLNVNWAFPGGTYTINSGGTNTYVPGIAGGNFVTYNDAYNAMATCGILGAVTFNVVPLSGPYQERLKMDSIRGTSVTNTITFNGNGTTITFDPANPPLNTERAVIKLNHADYITFDSLVIDASNGVNYGYGVQLVNSADSNTFRRNQIITSVISGSTGYAGVVINASDAGPIAAGNTWCDANSFEHNTITGGYYGVTLVGSATQQLQENRFIGNLVQEFYSTGFYIGGTNNTVIDSNIITRPTRPTFITTTGIFSTAAANNGLRISRNRIRNLFGGNPASNFAQYGIYHNTDQTTGGPSLVYNNLISDLGGTGTIYGLYNVGSNNVHYYHNTISLDSPSVATGFTRGYYQQSIVNGVEFKNNIITISRGGTATKHAIYVDNTTSGLTSDYNDFFVNATNAHIGYWPSANRTTLADWQAASLKDGNSLSIDPLYQNPATGDYRPSIQTVDNLGTNATSIPITTDILDVPRSTPPDMGAFEFVPVPCSNPVAGTASVTPNSNICLQDPITLDITGHSQLGTLQFQWFSAPSATGPWTAISPILYGPQFNTFTNVETYYRAAVTCGGTTVYTNVVNVVLNSIVMAGTYTIGNGATTWNGLSPVTGVNDNFATFQSAVSAMECGISGAVVFNVIPGTYNEQIRINDIKNTSAINTVTFQSATGNAADANLTFASSAAATNYTLKLDSTKYFTFRNLTISSTGTTYARAVEFANTASYDSLVGCNIVAPSVLTNSNIAAAVYANPVKGENLTIKKNNISNGSNGIYFSGLSVGSLTTPGHLIDSNTVSSTYHTGIYVQYTDSIRISNNTVNFNGANAANAAGINTNYADSGYHIEGNRVNINNTTATVYGLYIQNSRSTIADSGIIRSNTVIADAGNAATVYGLTVTGTKNVNIVNNVVGINAAGMTAYGMHSLNNTENVRWYNNTSNITSASSNGYAAYFNHGTAGQTRVFNNIFNNTGGGRALFVNNPTNFFGDYNMLHTSGTNLVQTGTGLPTNFTSLKQWQDSWNWDRKSIDYVPALVSTTDLRPNIANDSSWAMHGRGVQIPGNSYDFYGQYRPQTLTEGVPDLGAFEFYPSVLPTILPAFPATPAPNTEQYFVYGTDTVMKLKWGAVAPPSVEVRRYSGVIAPGLGLNVPNPRPDSMYFYTSVETPGPNYYSYSAKLYYWESWMASIPEEYMIGMGRKLESNAWVVGYNSKNNLIKNEISQESLNYFDLFTGLINPAAQKDSDDSTSNRGKDFWIGYQRTNGFSQGNAQQMVLYLGAGNTQANVTVTIEGTSGTPWVRNYVVPPNSAIQSDFIPKIGGDDARLQTEGMHAKKGIHIVSDVPIVAYAHTYESTNSGATMLMPTTVWGYEYYTLNNRQNYSSAGGIPSATVFHIVAKEDSTWVEINPSKNTVGGWTPSGGPQPNGSYLVKLNKGDAYQVIGGVLSGAEGLDLTGSYVKSIANAQGQCFPIAVFAGSSRTGIGCGSSAGSSGDFIVQQIFPYQAWGTKYATAPPSNQNGPNASSNMSSIFRVMVKDPATQVKRNNVTLDPATLINGRYYQFESGVGDYIEANKPVMVAQYMSSSGSCTNTAGDGDPEMFYLSPIQQAVRTSQFYRNEESGIDENFITLVIPTEGLTSLRIDGVNWQTYPPSDVYAYNHPNLPNYSIVTKRWPGTSGSSIVESDQPFTGIVYGLGSAESYGYNLGTLVRNLNNSTIIDNTLDPDSTATGYTCQGAPFTLTALLPVAPDSIRWNFSAVSWLTPNVDSIQHNPVAIDTVEVDGVLYYVYTVNQSFVADTVGNLSIPVTYYSQELESCDKSRVGVLLFQILPSPVTDFQVSFSSGNPNACEGDLATFTADVVTANGIAVNQWNWTFHDGTTPSGQIQTKNYPTPGTYPVSLRGITADGCISDTTKQVTVNAKPPVDVVNANVEVCPGTDATFNVQNPIAGATYYWYNVPTGGSPLDSGVTYTATGVVPPATFYVEGKSPAGCVSVTRTQVDATLLSQLAAPVVTFTSSNSSSATFDWSAIAGASSYEVSTDGGATWSAPSSGATGLSHTVSGLTGLEQTCILVRVLGTQACQTNTSTSVCGCTNSAVVVTNPIVSVCTGATATFTVQSPIATATYTWYDAATGGSPVGTPSTGTTWTSPAVTGSTDYWVEATNGTCTGSPRTKVTANILPPLTPPVVTATGATVNSLTFTWAAVPGAASYEVSVDTGTTWITPSSGATGLSHVISGLAPVTRRCILVRAIGTIACQTSQSAAVCDITKPDQIFIPNTFTPNADLKNDVLTAYGFAIQTIQFMVFNQWGEKIHEVTTGAQDANGGFTVWDGKYKGTVQPVGVYVYTAKITLKDGTVVQKSGALNIVR